MAVDKRRAKAALVYSSILCLFIVLFNVSVTIFFMVKYDLPLPDAIPDWIASIKGAAVHIGVVIVCFLWVYYVYRDERHE